ncbi:hypothetical protein LTR56_026582 [Elasticomyces elasticus]|nr:hypothetical protein LTR56_026582 [Elasticomyces elasticus]
MLAPPSSIDNHWYNPEVDYSNDVFDATVQSGLVSTDGSLENRGLYRTPNTYTSSRTNSIAQAEAPQHMHINDSNGERTSSKDSPQIASRRSTDNGVNLSDDTLAGIDALGIDALGVEYSTAITALPTRYHRTMVRFVLCIGSSSAVLSLRLVVGNFRELHHYGMGKANATRIAATRSSIELLAAIDDLSACMAHFTLAQRMHIYMLYKEALSEGGQSGEAMNGRESFILESGASAVRSRGNPNHVKTAAITRNMTGPGQSISRAKKLRRVGCRLDVLVNNFGRGILALLDENLTYEMILKVTDRVFIEFVAVIDRFEGDQIRLISQRACPIVDMLFDDGERDHATVFHLENLEDDLTINRASRCSLDLAKMLLPQPQMDGNTDMEAGGGTRRHARDWTHVCGLRKGTCHVIPRKLCAI